MNARRAKAPRTEAELHDYYKATGDRMRITRLALGLTESQAAEAWQISLATYRRYEAGARQRSAGPLVTFCRKFLVSYDWLIAGDASALAQHLAINKGGKIAILPAGAKRAQCVASPAARPIGVAASGIDVEEIDHLLAHAPGTMRPALVHGCACYLSDRAIADMSPIDRAAVILLSRAR